MSYEINLLVYTSTIMFAGHSMHLESAYLSAMDIPNEYLSQ